MVENIPEVVAAPAGHEASEGNMKKKSLIDVSYSGPMRNKWGRIPSPQDRFCCAGCDHFILLNDKNEHWFPYLPYCEDGKWQVLGPCKAKETYDANDLAVL